jgi:hypothetical protein
MYRTTKDFKYPVVFFIRTLKYLVCHCVNQKYHRVCGSQPALTKLTVAQQIRVAKFLDLHEILTHSLTTDGRSLTGGWM